jgi:hypothetical protein
MDLSGRGRLRSATVVLGIALAGIAAGAPVAQADSGFAPGDNCPTVSLEQPFLPWQDSDLYALVPNGDVENSAAGWSLDGASVVPGNEPFYVHRADDSRSLSIPSGADATSDTICVGAEERTLRLFVRSSDPSTSSKLKVEVVYQTAEGSVRSQPLDGILAGTSTSWTPYVPISIGMSSHPQIDGKTPVRFRFTAQGPASWQIDDVYVDPRHY